MSRANMTPIKPEQLYGLMAKLGLKNRKQLGALAGVTQHTVSFWIREGKMPTYRYEALMYALDIPKPAEIVASNVPKNYCPNCGHCLK